MKKLFLIILAQALLASCVQEIKEAVSGSKDEKSKSTGAIEGSVSVIINNIFPSAYAGNLLLCQSQRTLTNNVYAKLIGIKADGSKEEVCDTDIVNGNYKFDITEDALNQKYKGLMVEVIDNRETGSKQYENRKAIVNMDDRRVDINPETSIVSEFIENLYLAEIFSGADPEQSLADKKNDLSISKIRTILPDIFADGVNADESSLSKAKSFFTAKKDDSAVINAVKAEVVKTSPSSIDSSILGDMCDVNFKSSFSCYKITESCFDDYKVMWGQYAGVGYSSGNDVTAQEISPLTSSPSCVDELVKVTNWHLNQLNYLNQTLDCSNYFDHGQPITIILDEQDTSECNWDKGFYLYVHGNDGTDQCLSFDLDTCMDPNNPNMLCQPISMGGCMPDMP